ncbi:Uma2 family endonuclease [Streptomyces flaveus]|uniref:Uma2 family endonuclease n=1 Tax=Streptomyces flaveus TaxID=66370 RepID=UPI00332298EE
MTVLPGRPTTRGADPKGFAYLLDALDEMRVPDGYKAEVVEGNIVVSPWPPGYYTLVMERVCDQLRPHLPKDHRIANGPLLYVFHEAERAHGPDIHATHRRTWETTSNRMDGQSLSFVAELTQPSTRDDDMTGKVTTYGSAGVAVYLLLDMQEERATVLWTPSTKGYESHLTVPFGEKLHIPAPFNCRLDTDGFQSPREPEKG